MEQRVLLTGAGDSVGRLIAEHYLAQGAKVHICDVRPEAVEETLKANPGMHGTVTNVGSEADVDKLFEEAFEWMGDVNILVNMVGIAGPTKPTEEITGDEWRQSIDINLNGMFYTVKKVIPQMKKNKEGSIVNFSTASTKTALPNRSPYIASKYYLDGFA